MRLVLLALALATSAAAQAPTGTLTGIVTDNGGEAILGATVFLPEIQRGAATDLDGNYTITGIPVGVYEVQFTSVGFGSKTYQVEVLAGQTRYSSVALESGDVYHFTISCFTSCYERPIISTDVAAPQYLHGLDVENRPDRYGQVPVSSLMSTHRR